MRQRLVLRRSRGYVGAKGSHMLYTGKNGARLPGIRSALSCALVAAEHTIRHSARNQVEPGVTYRDVRVRWRLAAAIEEDVGPLSPATADGSL
jgi:hypothetical protein